MKIDTGRLILRIDFLSNTKYICENEVMNAELYEFILGIYPYVVEEKGFDAQLNLGSEPNLKPEISSPEKRMNFIFTKDSSSAKVTLSEKSLFLELDTKDDFESQYKSEIIEFLRIVKQADIVESLKTKRIGVRLILNILDVTIENSSNYLSDEFISGTTFLGTDRENIVQTSNFMDLSYENLKIRFIYGYLNKNFPSKTGKFTYVVDVDGYTNQIISGFENFSKKLSEIKNKIEEILSKVYKNEPKE